MIDQPDLRTALLTIRDASPPEAGLMAGVDTWSALVERLQKIAGDAVDAVGVRPDGDGLLSCPFCGGLDLTVYSNADIGCWVSCVDCGLETPTETGTTPDDATKYWNTRATPQPTRDAAEGASCCKGLAPSSECRCEQERKAAGHPPYHRAPPKPAPDAMRDAKRYRRLQVIGCAPDDTLHLANRTVLRFSNLDAFLDADIEAHPSRGDVPVAAPVPPADETSITINREALYRAISNHLPSDMIDAIWQEVIEALELKS